MVLVALGQSQADPYAFDSHLWTGIYQPLESLGDRHQVGIDLVLEPGDPSNH